MVDLSVNVICEINCFCFFRKIFSFKTLFGKLFGFMSPAPPNFQRSSAYCFVKMYMRMLSSYCLYGISVYLYIYYIVMCIYDVYIALFDLLLLLDFTLHYFCCTYDFGLSF